MDSWTEQAARLREMQCDVRRAYENGEIDVVQMTKLRLQIADRQHTHALSRPKDVPRDTETTAEALAEKVVKKRNQALRDRDKAQDEAKHYRRMAADERWHRERLERQRDELMAAVKEISCSCTHAVRARRIADRILGQVVLKWREG